MNYLHEGSCLFSLSVSTALPNDSLAKSRSHMSRAGGARLPVSGLGGATRVAGDGASTDRFCGARFSLLAALDRSRVGSCSSEAGCL